MTPKCPHPGLKDLATPPGEARPSKHRARTRRRREKPALTIPESASEDSGAARLAEDSDRDDVERGTIPDAVRTGRDIERE
jgi:hypothetical protein